MQRPAGDDDDLGAHLELRAARAARRRAAARARPRATPRGDVDPLDERVGHDDGAVVARVGQERDVDAELRAVGAAEVAARDAAAAARVAAHRLHRDAHPRRALDEELGAARPHRVRAPSRRARPAPRRRSARPRPPASSCADPRSCDHSCSTSSGMRKHTPAREHARPADALALQHADERRVARCPPPPTAPPRASSAAACPSASGGPYSSGRTQSPSSSTTTRSARRARAGWRRPPRPRPSRR